MIIPAQSPAAAAPDPVVAPSSQDLAEVSSQQDSAWADENTDTGSAEAGAPDGGIDKPDADVITDAAKIKNVIPAPGGKGASAVVPPAKVDDAAAGAILTAEQQAAKDATDEAARVAAGTATLTDDQKREAYWIRLRSVFPGADQLPQDPKFLAWLNAQSPSDREAASSLDKADDALKILGRYHDDLRSGRVKDPEPPAPPKPFEISEHVTSRKWGDIKVKLANGDETTVGDMAKPENYGDVLAAVGAMQAESEKSLSAALQNTIGQLIDRGYLVTGAQFNQLLARLGEKDLVAKVPDAQNVAADPKFGEFLKTSKLYAGAWASNDPDQRAEVINVFKAQQARSTVDATAGGQRKTRDAKAGLHKGSLPGGSTAGGRVADEGQKTAAEEQDAAWDNPLEVEGMKV